MVDFIDALGTWIEESILKRLHFSVMADECTDITAVEEFSDFCLWKNSSPVEFFFVHCAFKEYRC